MVELTLAASDCTDRAMEGMLTVTKELNDLLTSKGDDIIRQEMQMRYLQMAERSRRQVQAAFALYGLGVTQVSKLSWEDDVMDG
jgi:hypothetical protein